MKKIELGSIVKCLLTGFTGVTVARTQYINGCVRHTVVPQCVDNVNKLFDCEDFDEQQLIVVGKSEFLNQQKPVKAKATGGPERTSMKNKW